MALACDIKAFAWVGPGQSTTSFTSELVSVKLGKPPFLSLTWCHCPHLSSPSL
ncbi:hypothetical protein DEO72_LG5g725 [Vigna unguiculata]|uniref:Uncharacterized protein n=1 Tax=Vigna unguiculata TaxID=3917 RepID=A0A4D6LVG8_VIGUN|nr:hypothetical protein DEO72_LG5g725 [Vigna unguiculata]